MKQILFPATARPHLARQQLLLKELKKDFIVDIWEPEKEDNNMAVDAIFYAIQLNNYLIGKDYAAILIRGDRYEMLALAMVAAYRKIPIIHLEGGDLSGVIDNKVRHAITQLADYHFCTNGESHKRLITMGISPDRIWDFGSLDVEFAQSVESRKPDIMPPYLLVAYHPIEGEDLEEFERGISQVDGITKIISVVSNKDYGKEYGNENYSPEDYINLMRYAACCVGNSSSLIKEASVLEVPVVNVGNRQGRRLKPYNVLDVPCQAGKITAAIKYQLENKYEASYLYYQYNTSVNIANKIKELL